MSKWKKTTLTILPTLIFFLTVGTSTVQAVTITLKSGKTIRGTAMDRYNDVIAVYTKKDGRILIPMRNIRTIHKGAGIQHPKMHKIKADINEFKRQDRGLQKDPKVEKKRQKHGKDKRWNTYKKKKDNKRKQKSAPPTRLQRKRQGGDQHPKGRKKYKG